jgi:Zn-dependent peptidase ImmA (M78 family)
VEVRREIGAKPTDPIDPRVIADLYGFKVLAASGLGLPSVVLGELQTSLSDRWSGATVSDGRYAVILENDFHPVGRRNATIAHEVSHILLEHSLQSHLAYERHCGAAKDMEEEADSLSGELLIPGDAARRAARVGARDNQVAEHFGVSVPFARWRMNVSGARRVAGYWTRG